MLSDTISAGVPSLAVNLCKQRRDAAADKSSTNSSVQLKCMALVMQHENSTIYTFSISPFLLFTYKGPAKSTPTLENGGASLTLNSGNAAVGGELYGFPFSFLQVTHSRPLLLLFCPLAPNILIVSGLMWPSHHCGVHFHDNLV